MTAEVSPIRRLAGKNYPEGGHWCRAYERGEVWPEADCQSCQLRSHLNMFGSFVGNAINKAAAEAGRAVEVVGNEIAQANMRVAALYGFPVEKGNDDGVE